MTFTSQQIEAITQSVLRELRSRGVSVAGQHAGKGRESFSARAAGKNVSRASEKDSRPFATAEIALNGKVITEDCLIAAEAAGRSVSLPKGAIVTPSGQDYIRRNNVTVDLQSGTTASSTAEGSLIVVGTALSAESAAKAAGWSSMQAGCDFDAAGKARAALPALAVCCSEQPSIVACLLNRDSLVRAAVITHETNIETLGTVMNPQVTCLNPVGWSFAALLRLFRQLSNVTAGNQDGWKELGGAR